MNNSGAAALPQKNIDRIQSTLDILLPVLNKQAGMLRVEKYKKYDYGLVGNEQGLLGLAIGSLQAIARTSESLTDREQLLRQLDAVEYLSAGWRDQVITLRVDPKIRYEEMPGLESACEPKKKHRLLSTAYTGFAWAFYLCAAMGAFVAAKWLWQIF
ncbi:MAG: hypothetical protein AB8G16_19730 [Gammaproteobacteria bacterium]